MCFFQYYSTTAYTSPPFFGVNHHSTQRPQVHLGSPAPRRLFNLIAGPSFPAPTRHRLAVDLLQRTRHPTMRLSSLLSLPAVISVVSALAIEKRDADFFSVRTQMHKDMSGRRGDPKGKYFREYSLERCRVLSDAPRF